MRLFDEKNFSAYGPFRSDLNALIAWDKSVRLKPASGDDQESRGRFAKS